MHLRVDVFSTLLARNQMYPDSCFLGIYIPYRSILQISCNIKKPAVFILQTILYDTLHNTCSKVIFCFDLDICKEIFSLRLLSFCQDIRQDPWRFIPLDISILVDQKIHMIILQCPFILRSLSSLRFSNALPTPAWPPDTTRIPLIPEVLIMAFSIMCSTSAASSKLP